MRQPAIGIRISRPELHEADSAPTPMSFQDIEISGNRAGLLALAEMIRKVAEMNDKGAHTHLWPDDDTSMLRSTEYGVTIALNSVK